MNRERVFTWVLLALLLLLLYLSFLIVKPFLTYVVLALVLGYIFHPVYRWFSSWMPHAVAALIMVLLVFGLLFVPTLYVITELVQESISAYHSISAVVVERGPQLIDEFLAATGLSATAALTNIGFAVKDYIISAAPMVLSSIASTILGIFIMFFLMFFTFTDGERLVASIKEAIPMTRAHKEKLFERLGSVTHAVMYGQFLTALIQGALGGLMFFAFGIPNPVFWGFIMMVLSFIPMLGTPLVWVPAAVIELLHHNYVSGFGLLIVGGFLVMNIDNFLKPRLIGSRAHLSTPLVLLGVLGGLQLFGFIGLILGPLILALLQTVLAFFHEHGIERKRTVVRRV